MAAALAGCVTAPALLDMAPQSALASTTRQELVALPQPAQPVPIAVYGFTDQTGQFKPAETIQTLSRALSQGATSVLIQSLRDVGQGRWFTVLERERVDNLLRERQIIADTRARYLGETRINPDALPALLFAGVLLEGGIIGYDADTITGGIGARYLGVGGSTQYRQDTITVYLRAVAVKTGEILSSVVARKTIVSVGLEGGAFRYVAFKDLLEAEAGFTVNEPGMVALEQAVQRAVHDLVLDGANQGIWSFADRAEAQPFLDRYRMAKGFAPPAGKTSAAGIAEANTSLANSASLRTGLSPTVPAAANNELHESDSPPESGG